MGLYVISLLIKMISRENLSSNGNSHTQLAAMPSRTMQLTFIKPHAWRSGNGKWQQEK